MPFWLISGIAGIFGAGPTYDDMVRQEFERDLKDWKFHQWQRNEMLDSLLPAPQPLDDEIRRTALYRKTQQRLDVEREFEALK